MSKCAHGAKQPWHQLLRPLPLGLWLRQHYLHLVGAKLHVRQAAVYTQTEQIRSGKFYRGPAACVWAQQHSAYGLQAPTGETGWQRDRR